jgi:hypothetical protein
MTCTGNEKGGILLELFAVVFILLVFSSGAARVHYAFERRFHAIVGGRNESIARIRGHVARP